MYRTQILGPSLFGVVYMKTVASFPEAMFYVFMATVLLSLSFLFLVQIPQGSEGKTGEESVDVDVDVDVDVELEAPAATADVAAPLIVLKDGRSGQQVIS